MEALKRIGVRTLRTFVQALLANVGLVSSGVVPGPSDAGAFLLYACYLAAWPALVALLQNRI